MKSAESEIAFAEPNGEPAVKAKFTLSRAQLRTAQPIELFYMLMVRTEKSWRFLVIPRFDLLRGRDNYVDSSKNRVGPGRLPLADEGAKGDALGLALVLSGATASGWGAPLSSYMDAWPDSLAPVVGGPGSVGRARR